MNLTVTAETVASWNGWYLNVEAQLLMYDMPYSKHPNFYEVRLAEIESVDDIEQWCSQIKPKTWVTPECVQGLRNALYSICYVDIVQRQMIDECQIELLSALQETLRMQVDEAEKSFEELKGYVESFEGLKRSIEGDPDEDNWNSWLDIRTAIGQAASVHSEHTLKIGKMVSELEKPDADDRNNKHQ